MVFSCEVELRHGLRDYVGEGAGCVVSYARALVLLGSRDVLFVKVVVVQRRQPAAQDRDS